MAYRLTPPVFAREVQGRLMDVGQVQELTGLSTRQSVWNRVRAGTLPQPVLAVNRSYALWDRVAIERLVAKLDS
jgi:predicted DNA-binding transcriptional regulator AlpA